MIEPSCQTCQHYNLIETRCAEPFSLRQDSIRKIIGPCKKFIEKQLEKDPSNAII